MKNGLFELDEIYTGDQGILGEGLEDDSIDLVFTDPPYPKEFLKVYYDMGRYAKRVLKPGGSLVTLCGHWQVPQVIEALSTLGGLDWHWQGWLVHGGPKATVFGYKVVCGGKPLLWMTKGKINPFPGFWWDTQRGGGRSKNHHEWEQREDWAWRNIKQLCEEGGTVLDPFIGGGTVAVVCKGLRRHFLGFELEPEQAQIARRRLDQTPVTDMLTGFDQIPIGVLNNDQETDQTKIDIRPTPDLFGGNGDW